MSDPYIIEVQIHSMLKDRREWIQGKKYATLNREAFNKKMESVYSYLHTASSTLYNKTLTGELDNPRNLAQLNHMLTMLKEVHDGKRTQEAADHKFGLEQHNKYVKPVIDKLDSKKPPGDS